MSELIVEVLVNGEDVSIANEIEVIDLEAESNKVEEESVRNEMAHFWQLLIFCNFIDFSILCCT